MLRTRAFNSLIAAGALPTGYATDEGVGLVYQGTELDEVVSEQDGKAAECPQQRHGSRPADRIQQGRAVVS